ncbi:hypothetical protein [Andreprevotia sp. IGB-42]|uniref:hypothetical protein n=1 Tax=Andreprevotia sp. IGB-42 TaxID=2497473 RepID=UPI00135BD318|nr:hypothetical protein [Andreprevotia sp. IGB-42]
MTTKLEIIPSGQITDLSLSSIQESLRAQQQVVISDVLTGETIDGEVTLTSDAYTVIVGGLSCYLRKSFQDFDIEPAIEYLNGEYCVGLDVNEIAQGWEKAGLSYQLSSDSPLYDESPDFVNLVAAVCNVVSGVIFVTSDYYDWCEPGIYSVEQFLARYDGR